ncbi:hypothetical protein Cob_v002944 [Colletotrichum orbiculare MAFF 240422]|uniref:Uncharacterized protein n=1 Tax=Colletotrichum orbiculare (strain 104-T / ATCC 96160 / CBS 514.97 / LARS 414 / MAFF 240422) TaxID=1213857 RepID=A0A484G0K1_COLOR|nr:hypothetical protein Cob_v002944 [Colletotrichum orbiculare MAFF 240422]
MEKLSAGLEANLGPCSAGKRLSAQYPNCHPSFSSATAHSDKLVHRSRCNRDSYQIIELQAGLRGNHDPAE